MSELDKLRKLLDEAGVSYLSHRTDVTIGYYSDDPHSVIEAMDHSLQVTGLTSEQVMRALGPGTCKAVQTSGSSWMCSECGCEWRHRDSDGEPFMDVGGSAETPRFCPWCGAKVVNDG